MAIGHSRRRFMITTAVGAADALMHPHVLGQSLTSAKGDLVILLPGIAGTVLKVHGRDAWAPSFKGVSNAILTLGASLTDLRLTDDTESEQSGDGVDATQLVNDVHLIPGLWRIDGYTRLIGTLSTHPGLTANKNFFTFPYDWRKDNRVAARQLARQAHAWLQAWRVESGNANARLVLIAHSMGGLVSRYFLECLEGWKTTRKLITFGTPYRGSLNALDLLHGGVRIGRVQLAELGTLLRSFTSVYQLLPTYPCIDDHGVLRRVGEMQGIDHIDPARVLTAMKFHQEIEDAVRANLRNDAYVRHGYQVHPIVGVSQKTKQFARRTGTLLRVFDSLPERVSDGDGTVPRPSATPPELSGKDTEMFISENHGSLQNSDVSRAHLTGLLSGGGIDWDLYRSRTSARVSLAVPDAVASGKKIVLQGGYDPDIHRNRVQLTITDLYSSRKVLQRIVTGNAEGTFTAVVPALPAGAYRVTALFTSSRRPESRVSDVMAVIPAAALL